jgi:hypothetical protein
MAADQQLKEFACGNAADFTSRFSDIHVAVAALPCI